MVLGHASPPRDKGWNNQRVVKLFSEIVKAIFASMFVLQTA